MQARTRQRTHNVTAWMFDVSLHQIRFTHLKRAAKITSHTPATPPPPFRHDNYPSHLIHPFTCTLPESRRKEEGLTEGSGADTSHGLFTKALDTSKEALAFHHTFSPPLSPFSFLAADSLHSCCSLPPSFSLSLPLSLSPPLLLSVCAVLPFSLWVNVSEMNNIITYYDTDVVTITDYGYHNHFILLIRFGKCVNILFRCICTLKKKS